MRNSSPGCVRRTRARDTTSQRRAGVSSFPETRLSLVESLRSDDANVRERAREFVARVYRTPIIAVATRRWGIQQADAEDLAHDFLLLAFEKEWFARYNVERGRFRTFLRSCLSAFAATRAEAEGRLKRGGGVSHVSVDQIDLVSNSDDDADALFEQEWVRSILAESIAAVRRECEASQREVTFAVFIAHDVEGADMEQMPSYAELARTFAIPVTQVTNYLNWARRRFRAHVLDTLRALTATDAEFRLEARALLGVDVS